MIRRIVYPGGARRPIKNWPGIMREVRPRINLRGGIEKPLIYFDAAQETLAKAARLIYAAPVEITRRIKVV